ncbi:hypothetical protein N7532_001042 [Penicillium argentinense]|uniref:Uncharacterized protein n=1 Tax=Penicillium argentinense TaxID=1131581 RepID=A0A9W9KM48_9EURO|nr:uncharacterized protein N7532_001042 [Penicillium argentinense]KAJ5110507.1 hypothetical protein N7532_001042 [Penicillium argentinense]
MVLKKLWDTASSLAKRDLIPTICYDSCNDATIQVQSTGKTPELCEPNSNFMQSLSNCKSCIEKNSNSTDAGTLGDLEPLLDYCNENSSTSNESIDELKSELASISAKIASLGGEMSTSATNTPKTTLATTTSGSPGPVTVYATASGQKDTSSSSDSKSQASIIAPAVVVPVVIVGLIIILGFFFYRRRRSQNAAQLATNGPPPPDDKPQLHADDFRPELEGTGVNAVREVEMEQHMPPAELPVREEVAREMDANKQS